VVDLGLASTDMLYFAAGSLDAPGAMFTASHNPAQYNGVKFCHRARPDRHRQRARRGPRHRRAGARRPTATRGRAIPGSAPERDVLDAFVDHVLTFVDPAFRPMRVVADTANGMGGLVVPAVFERLDMRSSSR
jgi:phosphomannomutase